MKGIRLRSQYTPPKTGIQRKAAQICRWGRHSCLPGTERADKNVCPTWKERLPHLERPSYLFRFDRESQRVFCRAREGVRLFDAEFRLLQAHDIHERHLAIVGFEHDVEGFDEFFF